MKRLTDSFIFNEAVKGASTKNAIKSVTIDKDGIDIEERVSDTMNIIRKRIKCAGKGDVLDTLYKDKIKFLFNPLIKVPTYLNSMLTMYNGNLVAMVNITNFCRGSENIEIYPKTLFALMQNGHICIEMNRNWDKHVRNVSEVRLGSIVYSQMFCKVLDKLYALKLDPFKSDLVHFLVAKFFLISMCGMENSSIVDDIAISSAFNRSSYNMILSEASQFGGDDFLNINNFLNSIAYLNMSGLNIRVFLENWARMYGDPTVLAIDYLPSFYCTVFSTAVVGNIAKDYIIESVAGKQIDMLYKEFFKTF